MSLTSSISWNTNNLIAMGLYKLILLITIHLDYNVNTFLELFSTYDIVSYTIICLLLSFILSETLYIISNFYIIITTLYTSTTYRLLDHITFNINELSTTNTVLLSNVSLSLGILFINYELGSLLTMDISSILLSHLFISLQILEYQLLCYHINDSLFTTKFFILIGIHLSHVIIGI